MLDLMTSKAEVLILVIISLNLFYLETPFLSPLLKMTKIQFIKAELKN
jgi:hypothetical protein